MMKQLLKQIYNERRSNAFLWIELLLVFVVLWYIIDLVYVTLHIYYQPMGFNIENTYVLRMNRLTDKSTDFNPELTVKDDMTALREIAGRLSRHPEVESVCISQNSIPYNEGCSGASFRFPDNDTVWISTMDRWTTPEYYKVFRFRNIDGSGHESLVKALEKNTIIVPVDVADYYPDATFHGKDLLGKEVRMSDTNFRIAALTEPVRYDRYNIAGKPFTGTYIGTYLSDEQMETVENVAYLELSLRVREGVDDGFVERLMNDADRIYQVGNIYILDVYVAVRIQNLCKESEKIHWRQIVLVIQIILLFLVGLFPQSMNVPANAMMSFSCAMQVNAFRKFHGIPCATTMCIGNMRSATEMLCKYQVTGNQELKKKSMHYYFVILVFAVGAAMGALFIRQIGDRTIWIAAILLLAGFVLMFIKEDREDVRR